MGTIDRRALIAMAGLGVAAASNRRALAAPPDDKQRVFIAEAARMKAEAVAAGDQAYGAVVVLAGAIVGYGPSRVISDRNPDAHAERVALWDAQRRLGTKDLSGAVIYATSPPCAACQNALSQANLERMLVGPEAVDLGKPKRW